MLQSQEALRWGYHEQFTPPEDVINSLRLLCTEVLQPIRDELGAPLRITSGYRCPRVNAAVGGRYDLINKDGTTKVIQSSQHVKGEAVDVSFWVAGVKRNDILLQAIRSLHSKGKIQFDQLIKEYPPESNPQWIHISYKLNRLRNQVLKALQIGKKTTYNPTML